LKVSSTDDGRQANAKAFFTVILYPLLMIGRRERAAGSGIFSARTDAQPIVAKLSIQFLAAAQARAARF
jgi:hypothetical protein